MPIPSKEEFERDYWDYYLFLESRVIDTLKYVEFSKGNHKTYSREYVALLTVIWAEADKLFKVLCSCYGADVDCIGSYRSVLNNNYSKKVLAQSIHTHFDKIKFNPLSKINVNTGFVLPQNTGQN